MCGGVAIYVRENLQVDSLPIAQQTRSSSHVESLWLKVKVDKKRATIIGCFYRPPSTAASQVSSDYDDIEGQLQAVIAAYSSQKIILAGDLNSDSQTNPTAHRRLQDLQNYGLHNQVHDPTFFRGVTRSVLDVVLMSGELCGGNTRPECAVQQCDFTSHHRRVVVTTAISRTRVKPTYRTGRNWRALNTEEFIADVRCTDWTAVVRPDDSCELQWEHLLCQDEPHTGCPCPRPQIPCVQLVTSACQ